MRYTDIDCELGRITVRLDTGGHVQVWIKASMLSYYGGSCDIELDFISDDLKDIGFMVDGFWLSALQLVQRVQNDADMLFAEVRAEDPL